MRKINLLYFIFLLFTTKINSEVPEIKRERVFTGDGLYGFMNGGADLFLEFGVKSLVNRDLVYKGENFTIDIYELPTPEDAYGIYSMHIFRCEQADTLEMIDCFSPYQLQAIIANLYISIVFSSGSSKARQVAPELLSIYVLAPALSQPAFPEEFAEKTPYSGNVKYLKGPLSVSNASSDLAAVLKEVEFDGIWFAAEKTEKTYRACIRFTSEADKQLVKATLSETDIIKEEAEILYIHRKEKTQEPAATNPFGF